MTWKNENKTKSTDVDVLFWLLPGGAALVVGIVIALAVYLVQLNGQVRHAQDRLRGYEKKVDRMYSDLEEKGLIQGSGGFENLIDSRLERILSSDAFWERVRSVSRAEYQEQAAEDLLKSPGFRARLTEAVASTPTAGLARKEELDAVSFSCEANTKEVEKLKGVYDSINIDNKENVVAIPILRKDLEVLSATVTENKLETNSKFSEFKERVDSQITWVYTVGLSLIGTILASLVFPLVRSALERRYVRDTPDVESRRRKSEVHAEEGGESDKDAIDKEGRSSK